MLIWEQAPLTQPATTTPVATPIVPTQKGPSTMFETGSSLVPRGSSLPRPAHDIASERLSRVLVVQEATGLPPCGKVISIEDGNSGGVYPSNSELKVEIGVLKQTIIEKDVLIGKLDI